MSATGYLNRVEPGEGLSVTSRNLLDSTQLWAGGLPTATHKTRETHTRLVIGVGKVLGDLLTPLAILQNSLEVVSRILSGRIGWFLEVRLFRCLTYSLN